MKTGKHTYIMDKEVFIPYTDSIAGPVEGEGSFGAFYDTVLENDEWGTDSFEKAEIKMHTETLKYLMKKSKLTEDDIDCIMGGDLLNQIITSTFSAREFKIPFMGIYSACASFGQALIQAAMTVSCGMMKNVMCCTSSHYSTAERTYRFPLEMGTQPAPASQWTVTGTGSCIVSASGRDDGVKVPQITGATVGRVLDYGINDTNNMGAAMAPPDVIIGTLRAWLTWRF